MKATLLALDLLTAPSAFGQDRQRIQYTINESWIFFKHAVETPVALSEIAGSTTGSFRAVQLKTQVTVDANESLVVDVEATQEQAVLNGMKLNRKL